MGFFVIILLGVVVYLLLDIKRTLQKKQAQEIIMNTRKIRTDLRRSIRKNHLK